ncbi:MAG: RluA family pseudouridine synthase [Deltaproteobacteria bacterium]|nr:RluA family pseudouridine synthase [Deltaproteobacteria bacterium]
MIAFTVTSLETGCRLDTIVAGRISALSRTHAARLIRQGCVTVNGRVKKAGYPARHGDAIRAEIPPPQPTRCHPQPIPVTVLFEDAHLLVVDKPAGMVVHPAPGHKDGTLVNALLHLCPNLEGIGGQRRPGIVHRLDKDTSGCLVVAKNSAAHEALSRQFKARRVEKSYIALVYGNPSTAAGAIDLPIGRHPTHRKKMSTRSRRARPTRTVWKVKESFAGVTLLEIDLQTGRTHQIRVHCAAIGHPVVGDVVYGGKKRWKQVRDTAVQGVIRTANRQLLHACRLAFTHPVTGSAVRCVSPLPGDMAMILSRLRTIGSKDVAPA